MGRRPGRGESGGGGGSLGRARLEKPMPLLAKAARVGGLRGCIIGASSCRGKDSLATGKDREAALSKGMGGRCMTRGTVLVAVPCPMAWTAAIETQTLSAEGSRRGGWRHRVRGVGRRWRGRTSGCWRRSGRMRTCKLLQDGPDSICKGGCLGRESSGRIWGAEVLKENLPQGVNPGRGR